MTNRFEQSTPPSIHDVYRGLPIGPGGISPFIYWDRGRHPRAAVRVPWRLALETARWMLDRLADRLGRVRSKGTEHAPAMPCPLTADVCR